MKRAKTYYTIQLLVIFNLLLALIAFIKDILLAAYFGTSDIADEINLAFFIPDTVGNNLIGAAIAISCIPILTKLEIVLDVNSFKFAIQKLVTFVFGGSLVTWICLVLLAPHIFPLFHLTTIGLNTSIVQFFYIMSPIIVAAPCWLVGCSILQASNRFVVPALTPIVYNLMLLLSLLICLFVKIPQKTGGNIFAISMTVSTIFVGIFTLHFVTKKVNLKWKLQNVLKKKNTVGFKEIVSTFTAYLFILFFGQIVLFAERFFAGSMDTGTIAALSYAYRISQFPIWVFIAAINTFILPRISIHVVKNDLLSLKRDLTLSFIFVITVSTVLSLLLVVFSESLIKIIFARGSFDVQSVKLTVTILKGYGLSIVGQSLYVFCTRYFVAEGKMRIPFTISLIGSILNLVLLHVLTPSEGAAGIGNAAAISSTINGFLILVYFIKNLLAVEQRGDVSYE